MPKSYFSFTGGKQLTRIGASWFVSYLYFVSKDPTHLNWKKVSTYSTRATLCAKNSAYHKTWINEIVGMNPKQLQRNKIGLTGQEIIDMAKILLPII